MCLSKSTLIGIQEIIHAFTGVRIRLRVDSGGRGHPDPGRHGFHEGHGFGASAT